MNNYHLQNRTYQFILFQNKAYHDKNKSQIKPLVKSRPSSANQVRKSNSSQNKIITRGKNIDVSLFRYSKNGLLHISNQDFTNFSNQNKDLEEQQDQLNQSLNYNSSLQRPQSASTDYFNRKYRSISSQNSTINKENNKMSENSTLQMQESCQKVTHLNNQFQSIPNNLQNAQNNGLLSSKSKSQLKPSNKSLHSTRRKVEQKRIEESNLQLLKNLSQIKPQVKSKRELDKEFVTTQKYKNRLSNFQSSGYQKPKIVIMNKDYLSPILHNYIEKKNIENIQSPTAGKSQNQSSHSQQFPSKRFLRRAQNHYNNGFVYDEDDTININKYLTQKNKFYQSQNYGRSLEYIDQNINEHKTNQINQDLQKYKEEMDYRRVVYSSHHSNGQNQNSLQDNSQNQSLHIQKNSKFIDKYHDDQQQTYTNRQSPQFNESCNQNDNYYYEQYIISDPSGNKPNNTNNKEHQQDEHFENEELQEEKSINNSDPNNYNRLEERRMNEQNNTNVMRVRDLVNLMENESFQNLNNQNKVNDNKIQNNQEEDQEDDKQNSQWQVKNNQQDSLQNKQNQSSQNIKKYKYHNEDQINFDLEQNINQNFQNIIQNKPSNSKLMNELQINGQYTQNNYQNFDNEYDNELSEVDEENYNMDSQQNNLYQKQNHHQQGKYMYSNIQLNQQNYEDNLNSYKEGEVIEEVEEDDESNPKSNKNHIRNKKCKYSNNQTAKSSKHNFSDHLLSYSNQQSIFNTPSFIQD